LKGLFAQILTARAGDYDGDTAIAIWEPQLVEPFRNANDDISVEPDAVKPDTPLSCFHSTKETVRDFVNNTGNMDPEERTMQLQTYLLRSVSVASLTGKYSVWYDNAVYKHGYGSPEAILLAFKYVLASDRSKKR
jgi:RNA-dependent RNA polymerase